MIDSEQHPYIDMLAREARRPGATDPAARERIMAMVRAEPLPGRRSSIWSVLFQPRFSFSPAAGALLAAGLVGIGVFAGAFAMNRDGQQVGQPQIAAASRLPVSDTVVKFVFVAPQAEQVSLVGDFNGWDASKTPMVRSAHSGLWTVTLPLAEGRHLYAFVVDGTTWTADPNAPFAPDDGFGHANSVRIVSRG